MRLASYLWNGRQHLGFFANDRLHSLTLAAEIGAGCGVGTFADMVDFLRLGDAAMDWAQSLADSSDNSCSLGDVKLLPPVTNPEKIICIGKNYAEHAEETGSALPKEPLFFTKFNSSLAGANDPVILPSI